MILAAIEGQLLIILLMVLFSIISWIGNKLNEKKQPPAPPASPTRRPAAESEEERMRRFLEALGMPPTEKPSPPTVAPPPFAPRPKPVVVKAPPPLPARPRIEPRPAPQPASAGRSLDELETTSLRVEQITLPELITPAVHEFDTVSSRVSATHEKAAPLRESSSPAVSIHELLRAALSSPQQLRSAFVLREILGPPPGLRG
jgi:hypothetical protein